MKKTFIHGIGHQAINVRDVKASKKFYAEVLGLEILYEDEEHVFLKVGSGENFGVMALLTYPKDGLPPVDPNERQGNKYGHFGFRAKTPEAVFEFAELLKKNNVPIIKGPYSRVDGASVYFLDPDGHTLEYLYLIEDPKAYSS